jgi:thiol-disulfide isomerase/thioredoxin
MKIKKLTVVLALMASSSFLNAQDEAQFKAYGKAITVMNTEKLALNDKEKEAFLAGVQEALTEGKLNEKDQEKLRDLGHFLDQRAAKVSAQTSKKLTIPMATKVLNSQGKETSLETLAQGKKLLVIDFWATWCGPCMQAMPELKSKAAKLSPHGIEVIGMNTEGLEPAEKIRKQYKIEFPWLVEPKDEPFTSLLKIDSIPRIVVLNPQGKVLFNGHPSDQKLNAVLSQTHAVSSSHENCTTCP